MQTFHELVVEGLYKGELLARRIQVTLDTVALSQLCEQKSTR